MGEDFSGGADQGALDIVGARTAQIHRAGTARFESEPILIGGGFQNAARGCIPCDRSRLGSGVAMIIGGHRDRRPDLLQDPGPVVDRVAVNARGAIATATVPKTYRTGVSPTAPTIGDHQRPTTVTLASVAAATRNTRREVDFRQPGVNLGSLGQADEVHIHLQQDRRLPAALRSGAPAHALHRGSGCDLADGIYQGQYRHSGQRFGELEQGKVVDQGTLHRAEAGVDHDLGNRDPGAIGGRPQVIAADHHIERGGRHIFDAMCRRQHPLGMNERTAAKLSFHRGLPSQDQGRHPGIRVFGCRAATDNFW